MLSISVANQRQNLQFEHATGFIEFGRGPQGTVPRFQLDDNYVSRDHLRAVEMPGGRVQLTNLSGRNPILFADGTLLAPGGFQELMLPIRLTVGETVLEFRSKQDSAPPPPAGIVPVLADARPGTATLPQPALPPRDDPPFMTGKEVIPPSTQAMPALATPLSREELEADGYKTMQPIHRADDLGPLPALNALNEPPSAERLTQWMETILALQRSDASPAEFYAQTARALVSMIGLDVGLVLLHGDKGWQVVARAAQEEGLRRSGGMGREFSQTVLRYVLEQRQTFYQDLGMMKAQESLSSVDAVVVSPVFGLQEEVVGAVYGLRRSRGRIHNCKVRPIEAQLVQLLAAAVGAYQARTVATRTRTQFEQFFSAELCRELQRDPGLLEGRGKTVTILMSDLRGFSTLSERLGPEDTCRLVRDVMERLSERIHEHQGVIVSYLGDGILAMWNAPSQQENHAELACRAALAMLADVPLVSATWEARVGHPLGIGIGINTGPAQVGNTGSSRKFMYGPLGNTVNLASRVEGATKHLKVPVLITGSTRAQIGDAFPVRRLCQVRVVGIQEPVDLYELHGTTASPEWLAFRDSYEAALALYESQQWLKTCQTLLPLLERTAPSESFDHTTLKLMKRSWSCLETPPEHFDPVLDLTSK
jgi:adenylate cyclase